MLQPLSQIQAPHSPAPESAMVMLTQGCCKHGHRCHTPCSLNPELLTLLQGRGLCGRHCNGVAPAIGRGPVMLTGQQEASY